MPFEPLEIVQIVDFVDLKIAQIYPQSEDVIELAFNQSTEVYAIAGLPGSNAGEASTKISTLPISALKAVKLNPDSYISVLNGENLQDSLSFYGITITSTSSSNQPVQIKTQGSIKDASFNFTTNNFIYCDTNGTLTQTPNSSIIMPIGYAINSDEIIIKSTSPIIKG